MKKILTSILTLAVVGGVTFAGTQAFFSDTETSEDNTFIAGSVDLQIDSTSHYDGMVCAFDDQLGYVWTDEGNSSVDPEAPETSTYPELLGTECTGTWESQDLEGNPFFYFLDLKPGDYGENTISVTVLDNDSHLWARVVGNSNADNGLTEPESDVDTTDGDWCGELAQNMIYSLWVDEGSESGWQGEDDSEEGDNILNGVEVLLVEDEQVLGDTAADAACNTPPTDPLATDWQYLGVIPGEETWYYGLSWKLPAEVGNEVQSDGIEFDMDFYVEQERNNPSPTPPSATPTP